MNLKIKSSVDEDGNKVCSVEDENLGDSLVLKKITQILNLNYGICTFSKT